MKILIADDNPIIRTGLSAMLQAIDETHEVIEAPDGAKALAILGRPEENIDMVLLDIRMPEVDGLKVLSEVTDVPIVVLTNSDDADIIRSAMSRGAAGYLVYGEFTQAELTAALNLCRSGGVMLSPTAAASWSGTGDEPDAPDPSDRFGFTDRERSLMQALAEGLSNQQIAQRLFLSEKTVKNYLNHMYHKMNVSSRNEAIVAWLRK